MPAKKLNKSYQEASANRLALKSASIQSVLAIFLEDIPVSLALREAHRALALDELLAEIAPPRTVLDVGCGDGSWWRGFNVSDALVHGIDISSDELKHAGSRLAAVAKIDISDTGAARQMAQAKWPATFDLVIGNCSLEHIPDLDAAFANIARLQSAGSHFVLFVPTPTWALQGKLIAFFERHSPRLSLTVAGAFDGFFQHRHLMDHKLWNRLLAAHGFEVLKIGFMGNDRQEFCFRLGLPSAFCAFVWKAIFKHYPNKYGPKWLKRVVQNLLIRFVFNADFAVFDNPQGKAYEYAILCRRCP